MTKKKQAFDALIHFIIEGSFIALSTYGRTVNTSSGMFAEMCTLPSHPHLCLPSLHALVCVVLGLRRARIHRGRRALGHRQPDRRLARATGPFAALVIVYQIVNRDPARHVPPFVLSLFLIPSRAVERTKLWPADRDAAVADEKRGRALIFFAFCADARFCGRMTLYPEWLTGSPSLDTSNGLYFWVYLVVSSGPSFSCDVMRLACALYRKS